MFDYAVPDIDEGIPLPAKVTDVLPSLSPREEMEMRARTVKLLAEISQIPLVPSEQDKEQATQLYAHVASDPSFRPDFTKFPNEVMAHLAELIEQSAHEVVADLSKLKHYVVNKLIYEVEYSKSSKDRISALSKLGEVDGVDAFKKRAEISHKVLPIEEVEQKLLNILDNIEYSVLPASSTPDVVEAVQE